MKYPEIIDLHMHTTASDGTDTPKELIAKIRKAGIELFAVTDHDGIQGALKVEELLAADPDNRLLFLKGIEFSCKDEFGKYHILGYGYDAENEKLKEVISFAKNNRREKAHQRLEFLKQEFGFTFAQEDIEELFQNENPGKPHIANMMIKYGYASSIDSAMKDYLNKKKLPVSYISPQTAIETVLAAGGIPILAHPAYGDGTQLIIGEELKERVRRLIGFGLEGLECYYSGFSPKLISDVLALAQEFGLYVTAGSDYHGNNKLVQLSDTNLDSVSSAHEGLRRFLARVLGPENL